MGENVYELFTQKLKGIISKEEFNERYESVRLADIHDINSEYLYGGL